MNTRLSMSLVLFSITAFFQPAPVEANGGKFVDATFQDNQGTHQYRVYVPRTDSTEKLPVILFLHSASERGDDGDKPIHIGLGPAIRARSDQFPFVAVFPQCDDMDTSVRAAWGPETSSGQRALAILDEAIARHNGDPERIYLIGCSMGGYGAWAHAAADPDRWAAVVPICGGGNSAWAEQLKDLPIWCFHGNEDRAVPVEESRIMIDAIRDAGGQPRYSELPGVRHGAWDTALHVDELYRWLLRQRRGIPAPTIAVEPSISVTTSTAASAPFVAALDIPNAASVRLGNNMLRAMGHALPRMPEVEEMGGTLPNNSTSTSTPLGPMSVQFVGLRYTGKLGRANIKAHENGTIVIGLRARNVNLTIDRTYVSGSSNSATCGPIHIQLGHRYDLTIKCVVRPMVTKRKLKLKLESTDFHIPSDNWYVSSPDWVQTRGLFITQEQVSSSLRQGFYRDRRRIEQQIERTLPEILDRLADTLPLERAEEVVRRMWPMPVYAPRVKAWPSSVAVDKNGVTVRLGISVAALNREQAAAGPQLVQLTTGETWDEAGSDFQLSFAPSLLEPLSRQVVEAGVARILVVDSPLKSLMPLADATSLSMIVPDLNSRPSAIVRSEIVMNDPCRLNSSGNDRNEVEFELPNIKCQVSVPSESTPGEWIDYLSVHFSIRQRARLHLDRPTPSTRVLSLHWMDEAEIDVAADFEPGYSPANTEINIEQLRTIIASAWREWITDGPLAQAPIADLRLGPDRLRAEDAVWRDQKFTATFVPAVTEIRNATGSDVAYQTKGPFSRWSSLTKVPIDKSHRFKVAYAFHCRFKSGDVTKTYTLDIGRQYEFRRNEEGALELLALPDKYPERAAPTVEARHEAESIPHQQAS